MSGEFSQGARMLAGMATRLFGWTPAQFWQSTPAELAAILDCEDAEGSTPLSRAELNSLIESDSNGR